jgi:hypothetical protein
MGVINVFDFIVAHNASLVGVDNAPVKPFGADYGNPLFAVIHSPDNHKQHLPDAKTPSLQAHYNTKPPALSILSGGFFLKVFK